MKRLLMLIMMLLTLALPALAEELPPEVSALLASAHPDHTLTRVVSSQDPVIAVMSHEDDHVLCIAEEKKGTWQLTVDNPSALRPGKLPEFLWEGGMSLFFRYGSVYTDDYSTIYDYHASLTPGGWSNVDVIVYDTNNNHETSVFWQDGCVHFIQQDYDQEGNPLGDAVVYPPYPQAGLQNKVNLADFNIEVFPTARHALSLQEIGDVLSPVCTVHSGVAGKAVSLIVDMPDGTRRFLGGVWDDASGEWTVTYSTPLPEGTGSDDFHSSGSHLYIHMPQDGDGYVTVSLQADNTWQVSFIGREDWFGIGPCWIQDPEGQYHYGTLDIKLNVERIKWNALPSTLEEAFNHLDRSGWAMVNNPDPADRLHLRTKASRSAASLGKYYNGTPVFVLDTSGEWVKVNIFGVSGWMMKKYLVFGEAMEHVDIAMPVLFVREELDSAPLYRDQEGDWLSALEDGVVVMGIVGERYYHVMEHFNPSRTGYMHQGDLYPGNG